MRGICKKINAQLNPDSGLKLVVKEKRPKPKKAVKVECDQPRCGKKLANLQSLARHMREVHNIYKNTKKFMCNFFDCGAGYVRHGDFLRHAEAHHPGWSPQYRLVPIDNPEAKRKYEPRSFALPPKAKRREEVSLKRTIEEMEEIEYLDRTVTAPEGKKKRDRSHYLHRKFKTVEKRRPPVKITTLTDSEDEAEDEDAGPSRTPTRPAVPSDRAHLPTCSAPTLILSDSDSDSEETVVLSVSSPTTYIDMPRVSTSAETLIVYDGKTLAEDLHLSDSDSDDTEDWPEV